jgi:hypothetical protein
VEPEERTLTAIALLEELRDQLREREARTWAYEDQRRLRALLRQIEEGVVVNGAEGVEPEIAAAIGRNAGYPLARGLAALRRELERLRAGEAEVGEPVAAHGD